MTSRTRCRTRASLAVGLVFCFVLAESAYAWSNGSAGGSASSGSSSGKSSSGGNSSAKGTSSSAGKSSTSSGSGGYGAPSKSSSGTSSKSSNFGGGWSDGGTVAGRVGGGNGGNSGGGLSSDAAGKASAAKSAAAKSSGKGFGSNTSMACLGAVSGKSKTSQDAKAAEKLGAVAMAFGSRSGTLNTTPGTSMGKMTAVSLSKVKESVNQTKKLQKYAAPQIEGTLTITTGPVENSYTVTINGDPNVANTVTMSTATEHAVGRTSFTKNAQGGYDVSISTPVGTFSCTVGPDGRTISNASFSRAGLHTDLGPAQLSTNYRDGKVTASVGFEVAGVEVKGALSFGFTDVTVENINGVPHPVQTTTLSH